MNAPFPFFFSGVIVSTNEGPRVGGTVVTFAPGDSRAVGGIDSTFFATAAAACASRASASTGGEEARPDLGG